MKCRGCRGARFHPFPSVSGSVKIGSLQNQFPRGVRMRFDTVIRNGTIVTATDTCLADVGINGDKVTAIAAQLPTENATHIVDAVGCLVIPGGIDVHTHLDMPFGGTTSADDFQTGTIAAAFGGTTTLIDFAIQYKGQTLRQAFDAWMKKAHDKAVTDYAFHCIITDLGSAQLEEMGQLIREGVTSFKLFMPYPGVFMLDDATIFKPIRPPPNPTPPTCIHPENARPAYAETCPQYLYLSLENMDAPGFEGAKYVFTPPLREKWHQEKLWQGLAKDTLQVVSTDHCPFCFKEQKELGKDDFTKIPNGGPGIEHRLSLVYTGGVHGKRFSPNRFVELVSTTPAKLFGLYPRKGTIAVGSDADLVIFDADQEETISAKTHHMRVDYSMFEGIRIKGVPRTVLSRGRKVIDSGKFVGRPGSGQFLRRQTYAGL